MAGRKVMVVDDSEITLEIVRLMLEDAGYDVVTIENTFKLNAAIMREEPDVILLDVNMPALSGDRVAAILKQHSFSREIPVLLHSDIEESELEELVETTGAAGYIRKTSSAAKLVRQLEERLAELL